MGHAGSRNQLTTKQSGSAVVVPNRSTAQRYFAATGLHTN